MSHKGWSSEAHGRGPAIPLPQIPYEHRRTVEKATNSSHRYSMASASSSGRCSSSSIEAFSKGGQSRPSGIPRPISTSSQTRLIAVASSRPGPNYPLTQKVPTAGQRTSLENRHRTIYAINQDHEENSKPVLHPHESATMNKKASDRRRVPISTMDTNRDCVLGIALPSKVASQRSVELPPQLIPELQALAAKPTKPVALAGPASIISSPSTQFTGSPSPWSASTAATTPISWSSASPYLLPPAKSPVSNKRSQTVPIPAIARTRLPRLPIVSETTAAPRASPEKGIHSVNTTPSRKAKSKTPADSPAPTPPPRSSSIQRTRSRSSSKSERLPTPEMEQVPPPLPTHLQSARLADHSVRRLQKIDTGFHSMNLSTHHNSLQDALNSAPARLDNSITNGVITEAMSAPRSAVESASSQPKKVLEAAAVVAEPRTQQSARSRLAKFSKRALFGRGSKDSETETETRSPRKLQKGPVAGTGHEGYGKYARRGRKQSNDGSTAVTDSEGSVVSTTRKSMRSTSRKDSLSSTRRDRKSQSDLDDFTASRLKPVVMRGGNQVGLSAPKDVPYTESNMSARKDSSIGNLILAHEHPSRTPMTTVDKLEDQIAPFLHHEKEFDQDIHRISSELDKPELFEAPELVHPGVPWPQPYRNVWSTSQSSLAPSSVAVSDIGSDLYNMESNMVEIQQKKSRRLKWNIFRRREDDQDSERATNHQPEVPVPGMPVAVSAYPVTRSLPYYAMLESEGETSNTEAIGDYLNEAATAIDPEDDEDYMQKFEGLQQQQIRRAESVLLPSAPRYKPNIEPSRRLGSSSVERAVDSDLVSPVQAARESQTTRQPRLAVVGRIPKVPTTSNASKPDRMSFSRPFPQKHMPESQPSMSELYRTAGPPQRPSIRLNTGREASQQSSVESTNSLANPHYEPSTSHPRVLEHPNMPESLKLNDRQSTTSSSSEGMISVMGPSLLPIADLPRSVARRTLVEEDVWNEYDDLLDHVVSPSTPTRLNDHSKRGERRPATKPPSDPSGTRKNNAPSLQALAKGLAIDTSFLPPPIIYASPDLLQESDADEIRLRRSRIVSALHSSIDPSSPFSIGDYLAELGDPKRSSDRASGYLGTPTSGLEGLPSPSFATFPRGTLGPLQRYDNAVHIDEVQRTKNPTKHSELAYTSLMVSRWLSFGRVLFSPAHADVEKTPERHVLVIDGLGSDDWSIYCAVTYQSEHAYIYDLKETGRSRTSQASRKSDSAPPNLRRREVRSFYDPLKFPDNFFSAIVLRFPSVMAESKLRNLIGECRRVLAPGGYMELMLLDLDIVNMGVLTRRAMRNLKMKIAAADSGVSLKPVIDNFQSVLGEAGFSKLSRCVVGVPVVGKPPGAAESPVSSRSSGGSDGQRIGLTAGPLPFDGYQERDKHNFSLNDLVADHSENADAKISKMVSRTARSWWQHCFEAAVIADGNLASSILTDRQVLKECKTRASSFKLLIAFTQKPFKPSIEAKRRTMSEPVVATLATA